MRSDEGEDEVRRLKAIRHELDKPPEVVDIGALVPTIVPSAFAEMGGWPGPIHLVGAAGFAQTWVVLGPEDVIVYVNRRMQSLWEREGIPWRDIADRNLRTLAESEPYNGGRMRDDGTPFILVMLYPQGLGPARLLVRGLFDSAFTGRYQVAVPERSCAVAFALDRTSEGEQTVDAFITGCFEQGTEPVSPARFNPELLWELTSGDLGAPR